MFRTDANSNPAAFTTDVAAEAWLTLGKDYDQGQSFQAGTLTLYTAKLLGDPVAVTIRVIDAIGFKTSTEQLRWTYIAIPHFIWLALSAPQKRDVIGYMYQFEGGTAMRGLFPNYGKM
jgi:hypothetical protein